MVAVPNIALNILLLVAQAPSHDSTGATARSAPLDSAGIQEAIGLGRQTKKAYGYSSSAWTSSGFMATKYVSNYVIYAQGPFGRVATAAAKNARNYQPFTADSIRPDMAAPVLTVMAYPDILDGLITAKSVLALATSYANGTSAWSEADGSTLLSLVIAGIAYPDGAPAPNTRVELPGVGYAVLNEQIARGDGLQSAGLTVNMIHVYLLDPVSGAAAGEIVVGAATSTATL